MSPTSSGKKVVKVFTFLTNNGSQLCRENLSRRPYKWQTAARQDSLTIPSDILWIDPSEENAPMTMAPIICQCSHY